jgi:WD40-like Beta Propeller Repeat
MALRSTCLVLAVFLCLHCRCAFAESSKPPITLDEYLNTTWIAAAKLSPDGAAAVISTETPDWKSNNYRHDLWLWTAAAGLRSLTHSGTEETPEWSPDGKWIAFLSDRSLPGDETDDEGQPTSSDDKTSRVWLIPVTGGEALPLYTEKLEAHSYAWSADSASIFFSVTTPLTPEQQDEQKEQWKDVIRWREQDRGDLLLKLNVAAAVDRALSTPPPEKPSDQDHAKKKGKDKEKPGAAGGGGNHRSQRALHRRSGPFSRREGHRVHDRADTQAYGNSAILRDLPG